MTPAVPSVPAVSTTRAVRTVVVTGCGEGIGRAIAEQLSETGWGVVGLELDEGLAESAQAWCLDVIVGDAALRSTHDRAAARARDLGLLTGWVNNAGITRVTDLADLDAKTAKAIIDTNGYGCLWGSATAVEAFLAQGVAGSIVNISSIHGRASAPDHAVYEFTKGGIDALTRSTAVSHGKSGIRCNAVAPGAILTPHLERQVSRSKDPNALEKAFAAGPPLGRVGQSSEVADVVTFLLSDQASYLTGQSLAVDGGWSAAFGQ